jgi:WD40 repeat protein
MCKAKTCTVFAFLGLAGWLVIRDLAAEEPASTKAVNRPAATAANAKPGTDSFGDPLPPYARLRLGTIRFRQGSAITTLRYLPDGKTLASIGSDQVIRFWEATTGRELSRFGTPVANNNALAAGRLAPPPSGDEAVEAAPVRALSADGKYVAAVEADQRITLWGPEGKEITRLGKPLGNGWRRAPVFSRNGKALAVAEYDVQRGTAAIQVFDVATGKETRLVWADNERPNGFQLDTFALAPDGKAVLGLGNHNGRAKTLWLWQVASGATVEVEDDTGLFPNMGQPAELGEAASSLPWSPPPSTRTATLPPCVSGMPRPARSSATSARTPTLFPVSASPPTAGPWPW